MRPFALIASIAAGMVAVYAAYMLWEAQRVPARIEIATSEAFKSAPPMICEVGNTSHTVGGSIHIFNKAARFDIQSASNGEILDLHVIVNREDTAYVWAEGTKTGSHGSYSAAYNALGLVSLELMQCKPWWVPDGGQFIPPEGVNFSQNI